MDTNDKEKQPSALPPGIAAFDDALNEVYQRLPPAGRESVDAYAKFRGQLYSESDRGCALAAIAYLDEAITALLRARMVQKKSNIDALLDQGRPASSFSTKIRLAFAMGLISEDVFHDLNILRSIRNKFAHLHGPLSFNDPSIADQCGSLLVSMPRFRKRPPRALFTHVITTVYTSLSIQSKKPPTPVFDDPETSEFLRISNEALIAALGPKDDPTPKSGE